MWGNKEKETYIKQLETLLKLDDRNELDSLEYKVSKPFGSEYIEIGFKNGRTEKIVTALANPAALLHEVANKVYPHVF